MTTALFDDCLTFKPANAADRFHNFAGTVLISIYPFAWINFILEVVQIATTKDLDYEAFTMRFPLVLFSIVFMGTISTLTATCLERYSLKFSSNGITFSGRGLTIRWDEIGGVACKFQPVDFGRGLVGIHILARDPSIAASWRAAIPKTTCNMRLPSVRGNSGDPDAPPSYTRDLPPGVFIPHGCLDAAPEELLQAIRAGMFKSGYALRPATEELAEQGVRHATDNLPSRQSCCKILCNLFCSNVLGCWTCGLMCDVCDPVDPRIVYEVVQDFRVVGMASNA